MELMNIHRYINVHTNNTTIIIAYTSSHRILIISNTKYRKQYRNIKGFTT